jgi:transposase
LLVQEALRDLHGGHLYVFRGKSANLIKIHWYDGLGIAAGAQPFLVAVGSSWPGDDHAGPAWLLQGIDWRMSQHTWRPQAADRFDLNRAHDQKFGQRQRL